MCGSYAVNHQGKLLLHLRKELEGDMHGGGGETGHETEDRQAENVLQFLGFPPEEANGALSRSRVELPP